jgi:hypothetical protein
MILSEPGVAEAREEGKTASGLDGEKVCSPLFWIEISNRRFWELLVVSFTEDPEMHIVE